MLVAGSTHGGEEEILLHTFKKVCAKYPKARMILAVREITRAPAVKFLVRRAGFSVIRRTEMKNTEEDLSHQVIILDTIGELGRLYSLADIVFVGGSFVKVGGHNILEPAAHGETDPGRTVYV